MTHSSAQHVTRSQRAIHAQGVTYFLRKGFKSGKPLELSVFGFVHSR